MYTGKDNLLSYKTAILVQNTIGDFYNTEFKIMDRNYHSIYLPTIKEVINHIEQTDEFIIMFNIVRHFSDGYKWQIWTKDKKYTDFKFYCSAQCAAEASIKYYCNHLIF